MKPLTWIFCFLYNVVKRVNGFHLKKCPEELVDLDESENRPPHDEDPPLGSGSSSEILNECEESIPPLPPLLPSLDELCRKRKVLIKYRLITYCFNIHCIAIL